MHVYSVRMIGEQCVCQCYLQTYWSLSWQIREVNFTTAATSQSDYKLLRDALSSCLQPLTNQKYSIQRMSLSSLKISFLKLHITNELTGEPVTPTSPLSPGRPFVPCKSIKNKTMFCYKTVLELM